MKEPLDELNFCFWDVGNDIADIRLLVERALVLYEGDAGPLYWLGVENNEKVAASVFDTIDTAFHDLCERIITMEGRCLLETIWQCRASSTVQN